MKENELRLSDFLRAMRARVHPEDVGLAARRSRLPGLRRQDLAHLASISVGYYTRLEQGRATQPSPTVLDAISAALALDEGERRTLYRLAGRTLTEPEAGASGA